MRTSELDALPASVAKQQAEAHVFLGSRYRANDAEDEPPQNPGEPSRPVSRSPNERNYKTAGLPEFLTSGMAGNASSLRHDSPKTGECNEGRFPQGAPTFARLRVPWPLLGELRLAGQRASRRSDTHLR